MLYISRSSLLDCIVFYKEGLGFCGIGESCVGIFWWGGSMVDLGRE